MEDLKPVVPYTEFFGQRTELFPHVKGSWNREELTSSVLCPEFHNKQAFPQSEHCMDFSFCKHSTGERMNFLLLYSFMLLESHIYLPCSTHSLFILAGNKYNLNYRENMLPSLGMRSHTVQSKNCVCIPHSCPC